MYVKTGGDTDETGNKIKYVGMFEGTLGLAGASSDATQVKYYVKITEHLGPINELNASNIVISVWTLPNFIDITTETLTRMTGVESTYGYCGYQQIAFTYLGQETSYYKDVIFNDIKYVFTPCGILTFTDIKKEYDLVAKDYVFSFTVTNIADNPYIPTLTVGRSPDGVTSTTHESANMLTERVKDSFAGTVSGTTYLLSTQARSIHTVLKLKADGTYEEILADTGYTYSTATNIVTFLSAPGVTPIAGEDNIIIKYNRYIAPTLYTQKDYEFYEVPGPTMTNDTFQLKGAPVGTLNALADGNLLQEDIDYDIDDETHVLTILQDLNNLEITIEYSYSYPVTKISAFREYQLVKHATVYGYQGDKRVFLSDGSNIDYFSAPNDISYFPIDNYTVFGDEDEIAGYGRTDGYLIVFKFGEDSCHVRTGMTLDGRVVFPSISVEHNMSVLGPPIETPFDELMIPTMYGIEKIYYYNGRIRHQLRSHYITDELPHTRVGNNPGLLNGPDNPIFENMTYFIDNDFLYIMLNNYLKTCFVADLDEKSRDKKGTTAGGSTSSTAVEYQYEWYKFTDFEGGLFFMDDSNNKYIYNNYGLYLLNETTTAKVDIYRTTDYVSAWLNGPAVYTYKYKPIHAYWETPFLDFNRIDISKTIRTLFLNTRSSTKDCFQIGYILPDGETQILEQQYGTLTDDFPKLLQIKNKIRKFMNVKLYIKNIVPDDQDYFISPLSAVNTDFINLITENALGTEQNADFWGGETTVTLPVASTGKTLTINHTNNTANPVDLYFNILLTNPSTLAMNIPLHTATPYYSVIYSITSYVSGCSLTISDGLKTPFDTLSTPVVISANGNGYEVFEPKSSFVGCYGLSCKLTVAANSTANFKLQMCILEGNVADWIIDYSLLRNTTFNKLVIEYQLAGRYRGE